MTETPAPTSTPDPYPAPAVESSGAAGRVSLVLGILLVVIGIAQQLVGTFLPFITYSAGVSYDAVSWIFAVLLAVVAIVSVIAVILGAVGIRAGRRGRLAAAAGLALGAAHLVGAIVSFVAPWIVQAVAL